MIRAIPKTITESGIVYTGQCCVAGMQIGMDGVNDPQITVYDGIEASGVEIIPTNTYDSSALGLNGFAAGYLKECRTGVYVQIEASGGGAFVGAVEITIDLVY